MTQWANADSRLVQTDPFVGRRRNRWLVVVGVYAVITLYFCLQNVLPDLTLGRPVDWEQAVLAESIYWAIWVVITPLILMWARRFPLAGPGRLPALGAHVSLAVLIAVLQDGLYRLIVLRGLQGHSFPALVDGWPEIRAGWLAGSLTGFYKYWMIVGIFTAIDIYRRYRRREREALDLQVQTVHLESQLTNARLEALRMQLHPHFLFNTLNAISVLISGGEMERARGMLLRLSDLLRVSLDTAGAANVPLKEEIEFLRSYLEIEQIRFEDRLQVDLDIDSQTLDVLIPYLILQPLVENAVRHGISNRLEPGVIVVESRIENGILVLEVRDSGPGLPAGEIKEGVGLSNTRERLRQQYGDAHSFELRHATEGGLMVRLSIPIQRNL